ncbi:MAG: fumarylacetoacetate hydrolase family protein [Hydrogenibacillus schlegelii]|uniref:Fumarylacetoacetate hydrolase family protein n=1 Tax=Hydrogenibacillus schlegelii TaxID=1484 RepID=A0A947G8F6_HYDSH|nr:fumarylacetoacetate hydrolase family protein [Hydrogenibacillus schlegelii]
MGGIPHRDLARRLWEARLRRSPISPLTEEWPEMTVDDAYAIQDHLIAFYRAAGDRPVGFKLGFTSAAMRRALGVEQPNYGVLMASMLRSSPVRALESFIHPRVEPEIAVRVHRELYGSDLDEAQVKGAIEAVAPALEIVDSRYEHFRFTFLDNTADNSSAAGVVLGEWREASDVDLERLSVVLSDGSREWRGSSADVMGSPVKAVAWLSGELARRGRSLPAGSVILTGGMTAPLPLRPGSRVVGNFGNLGTLVIHG